MTTPTTNADTQPPLLQQAPVVPLDASGFTAALVGTALFVGVTLVCWILGQRGQLMVILATGVGLGLFLTAFTAWHKWRPQSTPRPTPQTDSVEH